MVNVLTVPISDRGGFKMVKQHKMVNLCTASFKAAQEKANFSGWVRTQLLNEVHRDEATPSDLTSWQLLAVVLSRQQDKHGFDHPVVTSLVALINNREVV